MTSIIISTEKEIIAMRRGGKILAEVLARLAEMAVPGADAPELNKEAENSSPSMVRPLFWDISRKERHHPILRRYV